MCNFCKREQVTDDISEMVNIIGGVGIGIGESSDVMGLLVYLTENDKDEPILQADLYPVSGVGSIAQVNIRIKYCPNCGRKLV